MNKKVIGLIVAFVTFTVGVTVARLSISNLLRDPAVPPGHTEIQLSNYRLSGPYQHENLTIFLVHGPDQPGSRLYTPLQEAMERKLVIVHETSDVNELAIENVSATEEVFVQAGDIVKGGQQDRVLAVDLIVPAKSGRMPISAFCVEHSRWRQRGAESADHFTLTEMVATPSLGRAIKGAVSQAGVWSEVDRSQEKLSASVASNVRSNVSESSLQLTLENQKVQDATAAYLNKLSSIVKGPKDVIGFALAINNNLSSAEVYSSNAMFKRLWPRLLKAAAVEAVAERPLNKEIKPVSIAATGEFLLTSEQGTETLNEVTPRTHMVRREATKSLFFETRDMAHHGAWIHRSYLIG
jgi:hypothetical protein